MFVVATDQEVCLKLVCSDCEVSGSLTNPFET